MTQRLALVLVAILAFLAGAFWLAGNLFGNAEEEEVTQVGETPDAAPLPQPPDAAPLAATSVTTQEVVGLVEVSDEEGNWTPLEVGQTLEAGRTVRAAEGASAKIDVGGSLIEVGSGTDLVIELGEVTVGEGRVGASVVGQEDPFRVRVRGSDTVAEATDGDFSVAADGEGTVAVASSRGRASVSAKNKKVQVEEGQQSLVMPNKAPSAPTAIPNSLFLKLSAPKGTLRKKRFTVRGSSTPGTVVRVGGRNIVVGDDGRFEATLALDEGANTLLVSSNDAAGRQESRSLQVRVDTTKPKIGGELEWK